MKKCTGCKKTQPPTEYHLKHKLTGKRNTRCRTCCSKRKSATYAKKKKLRAAEKAERFERKHIYLWSGTE